MRASCVILVLLGQSLGTLAATADPKGTSNSAEQLIGTEDIAEIQSDNSQNAGATPLPGTEYVIQARHLFNKLELNPPKPRFVKPRSLLRSVLASVLPSFSLSAPDDASSQQQNVPKDLSDAVHFLEKAADQLNPEAINLLGELYFYGNFTWPRDFDQSFRLYQQLADLGYSNGHFMTGLFYSTGLSAQVPQDQARAHLYYTTAARLGHTGAQMVMGFRHHQGVATPKNCEKASTYYRSVAQKAVDWIDSGPPGGQHWVYESYFIPEEHGGVYGNGASVSSSGANAIKTNPNSDANADIDDVIEYLDLMSKKGDSKASLNLGRIYYEGQRGLDRDFLQARKYFLMVVSQYWGKDGRIVDKPAAGLARLAGKAATFLGRIHLRGEGVPVDHKKAKKWLLRGKSTGEAQAYHLLGIMHGEGLNGPRDDAQAFSNFRTAAESLDYAPAQVEVGKTLLQHGTEKDVKTAIMFFDHAARSHNLKAYYYLGEIFYQGAGRDKNCMSATHYFKRVAERVEPLVATWGLANEAYESGDIDTALVHYIVMAEQGWDSAQTNLAYLIDPAKSWLNLSLPIGATASNPRPSGPFLNPELAFLYWVRSSNQGNIDATVKVGDYYYYGVGREKDLAQATSWYTQAAEHQASAQALWNLGYMHENGLGLKQDFHLAKRYYDLALTVSPEAYLPVTLSLLRLRMRSAWNTLTHGSAHSIQDDPNANPHKSLREWVNAFMAEQPRYYEQYSDSMFEQQPSYHDEQNMEVYDDSILDSMLVFSIVLLIMAILYYRNQRQAGEERERQRQQQGVMGGGLGNRIPGIQPGQWGPGMVGH